MEQKYENENLGYKNSYESVFDTINGLING